MSDTGAPAAAPAEATTAPADTAPSGQNAAPPQKVDPQAELEAVLKKLGGLEVKAGGKAHKIDSVEKLVRYAQRGLPVEQSLEQIARQRAELEPVAALMQQLQSGDEDAAEAALEKLLDSGRLDKVAEKRLRRMYEREKQMEGMSERERQLAQALEAERSERTRLSEERKRIEQERAAAEEAQQVEAIKGHIGTTVTQALEKLGLPPRLEAMAFEMMKPVIRASINAGMPLDPQVLADKVGPVFDELLAYKAKNTKGEALLKFLGDDVGREVRRALLAQLNAGSAPKATTQQGEQKQQQPTGPEKWDPRRMY